MFDSIQTSINYTVDVEGMKSIVDILLRSS